MSTPKGAGLAAVCCISAASNRHIDRFEFVTKRIQEAIDEATTELRKQRDAAYQHSEPQSQDHIRLLRDALLAYPGDTPKTAKLYADWLNQRMNALAATEPDQSAVEITGPPEMMCSVCRQEINYRGGEQYRDTARGGRVCQSCDEYLDSVSSPLRLEPTDA